MALASDLCEDADDCDDPRPAPAYDFSYMQTISAQDVFLPFSEADASSASCGVVVVTVQLKGEKQSTVTAKIGMRKLELRGSKYRALIYLPHAVEDKKGQAKWDSEKEILKVYLPIVKDDQ